MPDEFPVLPVTSARTLDLCRSTPAGPDDVFIASYPKSGTTWTQNIVYTLATRGDRELDHISSYAPFYEVDSTWESETAQVREPMRGNHAAIGRRIFNTHLWPDMLPKTGGRIIYLERDGRDVVTSFYHHLTHQAPEDGGFEGSFDQFFEEWIGGRVAFGKWDVHVAKWRAHAATDPRVLVLRYEDMKRDLPACVARINSHCKFDLDENTITRLLPRFTVDAMRADIAKFSPRSVRMLDIGDGFAFVRKGTVGDHAALFSATHHQQFDAMLATGPLRNGATST
eukprot:m.29292 g.29292  ORF g.29292 m.29292 type:complete len:283 (+) comp4582_c0_seq1:259-1107(+)